MKKYKDTDLREALKRKYVDTPQLPDDFMAKMQERLHPTPSTTLGDSGVGRRIWTLRWIAAAACLLLVVGIGFKLMPKEEQHNEPVLAMKSEQNKSEETKSEKKAMAEDNHSHGTDSQFAADEQRVCKGRTKHEATTIVQPETIPDSMPSTPVIVDPNLQYAAQTETEDAVTYQDPSRVDDFIAKLADYNKVKGVPLNCTSDKGADSTIVSTAYLFEEKPAFSSSASPGEGLDIFAKLLQVACWYDTKTPGYMLNFSRQQFFFHLKDLSKGQKYLWVAERIGNRYILLYSIHSPIETEVSSACFQEYREQLTHKGINILNF